MQEVQRTSVALMAGYLAFNPEITGRIHPPDDLLVNELSRYFHGREDETNAVGRALDRLEALGASGTLKLTLDIAKCDCGPLFAQSAARLRAMYSGLQPPRVAPGMRIALWCADLAGAMIHTGQRPDNLPLVPICLCTMSDYLRCADFGAIKPFTAEEASMMLQVAQSSVGSNDLSEEILEYCAETIPAES